jgi:hypothetical protein
MKDAPMQMLSALSDQLQDVAPPSGKEVDLAGRAVRRYARDAVELALFLDMLGIN